uniref:Uncharacterized protein n=1 Tax=Setaria italica TaxID=4555 RepID=K4A4E8_SETIT
MELAKVLLEHGHAVTVVFIDHPSKPPGLAAAVDHVVSSQPSVSFRKLPPVAEPPSACEDFIVTYSSSARTTGASAASSAPSLSGACTPSSSTCSPSTPSTSTASSACRPTPSTPPALPLSPSTSSSLTWPLTSQQALESLGTLPSSSSGSLPSRRLTSAGRCASAWRATSTTPL